MAEPDLKRADASDAVVPPRPAVTRRRVLQVGAATAITLQPNLAVAAEAIRPFRIDVPDQALIDLRSRLEHARWPERETVADISQGVPLKRMQELADYWRVGYDWRRVERRLNALPQFMTAIDGLDIQFAHIRSPHAGALPLVMTHGWPGSVIELLKVIDPLTDPPRYGGRAEDAFHLVLPSLPGHGFSGKPTGTGWGPSRVARAWAELMRRLGYTRYVAQGGDHGSVVSDAMARLGVPGLLAIHVNMPATVPNDIAHALQVGDPAPASLSPSEMAAFAQLKDFYAAGSAYGAMMTTRPQTLGYGLGDSPIGLAAFFYEKFAAWTYTDGEPERALSKDDMLDDITFYWLTNTAASAARFYWENNANNFNAVDISTPAAITVFPGEIYRAPKSWADRSYRNLIYWNEVSKGGHFAAWEEPELFAAELRAAFRSLR